MKTKTKVKMDYMDLQAQDVNALVQLAFDKYHQGELDNALDIAQRSLELKNKNNPCVNLIGSILHSQGKVSESAHYFKEAIKHDPTNVECYYNLGVVLRQAGDMTASLSQQARALEINPEYIPSLNEAGLLYLAKKDNSSAGELLHRAYELDPKNRATLVNIAYHCTVMNLLNEAISFSQALIKVDPDCAEPYFTIGYALSKANFFEESVKYAKLSMNKTNKYSSEKEHYLLMNYLYSDQFSGEQIFEAHKSWSRKFLRNDAFPRRGNDDPHKKLKVGFISSDFREHSVSNFFLAIVENYNKSKFEYSCYSGVSKADFITERIRAAVDIWREVYDLSETGIVELIKQDEIDILVDLAGHSQGNYIRVFGHKPAPVQMTYLGYPFSTGLENMDYRITDEYADPKGMTEHLHTETLIRM
ncbi:MAG TPA: tetratricopeptide repeat protein, partial [Oceanospirillales bacterium]|nr:tetratricopeptide repeat protein [Oceanospirillales bacterium]